MGRALEEEARRPPRSRVADQAPREFLAWDDDVVVVDPAFPGTHGRAKAIAADVLRRVEELLPEARADA